MKMNVLFLLWLVFYPNLAAMATETSVNTPSLGAAEFEIPAWFRMSFLHLPEDVKEIGAAGKQMMILFHQEGCPYCARLIQHNFAQPEVLNYFQAHFEAVEINLWGDREVTDFQGFVMTEKDFAARQRVFATPTLLFFNEKSEMVLRLNGYFEVERFLLALHYVAEKQYTRQTLRAYLSTRTKAKKGNPTLHSEDFFAPAPHDLQNDPGDKPLAVFFEQPYCVPCDTLHNQVLSDAQVRAQLARFHVVQLNPKIAMNIVPPKGEPSSVQGWMQQLRIETFPTILLFARGQEVMRLNADYKASHLASMLDYVASGAYLQEPNLQRYLQQRPASLREQGVSVNLWK